jgi:hypothetical protein
MVANNNPNVTSFGDCGLPVTASDHSLDSDGTCGTGVNGGFSATNPNIAPSQLHGGPTPTISLNAGSPAINNANPAKCAKADQRFFVHTTTTCDIGSYQANASRPGPPTCTVTALNPGVSQTVTLQDTTVGLGPESGALADPGPTIIPPDPTTTVESPGFSPADAVTALSITNGTVSASAFQSAAAPGSTAGVTLTATKTTAGQLTRWHFKAVNWAGVRKYCN